MRSVLVSASMLDTCASTVTKIPSGLQAPPSSSGLGHRVLSPKTGVRLPLGVLAALYFKGFMHIGPFLGHIWAILL